MPGTTSISVFALFLVLQACAAPIHEDPEASTWPEGSGAAPVLHDGTFRLAGQVQYLTVAMHDDEPVYQGDILVDSFDEEPGRRQAALATGGDGWLWPDARIPYVIDPETPRRERVQAAIDEWNDKTMIELVPRRGESNFVAFLPADEGCRAHVGRGSGRREVRVSGQCQTGNIAHEIGHIVGLFHTHARDDRDDFIQVHYEAIAPGFEPFFDTLNVRGFDGSSLGIYEVSSLMHYGSFAFAAGSAPTITRYDGRTFSPQREGLSVVDARNVARLYGGL